VISKKNKKGRGKRSSKKGSHGSAGKPTLASLMTENLNVETTRESHLVELWAREEAFGVCEFGKEERGTRKEHD